MIIGYKKTTREMTLEDRVMVDVAVIDLLNGTEGGEEGWDYLRAGTSR